MRSWTYAEMKAKVLNDLDLNDEIFIPAAEMLAYFNEAIDTCEAHIHTLYADWFLTSANLTLVNGTATVSPPSDIYGSLIRTILYDNGAIEYEINRIKKIPDTLFIDSDDIYRYIPINTSAAGYKLKFYPTPTESSTTNVTIWYIRNAKVLALAADICDIPEFANYIMQFVKVRCYEKEGNPNVLKAIADLESEKDLMIGTLQNMTDDEHNEVEADFTFYADYDADFT